MHVVKATAVGLLAAISMASTSGAQTNAAPSAPPPQKTWADAIRLKGDVRYRYESIEDDAKRDASGKTYTRVRDRIRARLGVTAQCNEQLKAGLEVSTGQADPVSGNQSLGDGFGKKEFRLNQAYVDYSFFGDNPNEVHGLAGKMPNPFVTTPEDLVWDHDLTPEGLAATSQLGGEPVTLLANGGYLWAQERADKDDLMLYVGQLAAQVAFAPEVVLTVGGSYYAFQNMKGYDVVDWEAKNNAYGNSTITGTISGSNTNKAWATEYTPLVGFAKLELWLAGKPVTVFGQVVRNADADAFDAGHLYGLTLGKAKNPHTWELGYSRIELEKDATAGMFTDSDRWGGGTDGRSHKVYGKYQLMKNLQAAATYFWGERKISAGSTDYQRLQLDLTAAF